jgi:hypothetical protein
MKFGPYPWGIVRLSPTVVGDPKAKIGLIDLKKDTKKALSPTEYPKCVFRSSSLLLRPRIRLFPVTPRWPPPTPPHTFLVLGMESSSNQSRILLRREVLCSATSGDTSALLLLRSDSTSTAASTSGGFSSRSRSNNCISRGVSSCGHGTCVETSAEASTTWRGRWPEGGRLHRGRGRGRRAAHSVCGRG